MIDPPQLEHPIARSYTSGQPATQTAYLGYQNSLKHPMFAPARLTFMHSHQRSTGHLSEQRSLYSPPRQCTYLGTRSKWWMRGWRETETDINFKEATRAICQVIEFACALPLPWQTNNQMNAECQIRQQKTWQTDTGSSATVSPQPTRILSPAPLPPVSLPHPDTNAYQPPMLHEQPLHLDLVSWNPDLVTTHQNTTAACSAQSTQLAFKANDIHEAPTPPSDTSVIEMNLLDHRKTVTCPNSDKCPDIPK